VDKLGSAVAVQDGVAKCVLRIRYNISTDDYDVRNTSAYHNYKEGKPSPVTQNPTVNVGLKNLQGLKLAINTAQFGRTFQDRSHSFYVRKRPTMLAGKSVKNLQVRGKRGNIVQTFPSVEYDFVPNYMPVKTSDYIHLQWTGSNTHNNGNPAGDGQAGDAGEGTGGTDRHNLTPLASRGTNYPMQYGQDNAPISDLPNADKGKNFFAGFDCWAPKTQSEAARGQYDENYMKEGNWVKLTDEDCAAYLATGGYIKTMAQVSQLTGNNKLNPTLDNAPASLQGGLILKPKAIGEYHYMCTRNNNFSNRSQKGTIMVGN
jgi:plastocyanin